MGPRVSGAPAPSTADDLWLLFLLLAMVRTVAPKSWMFFWKLADLIESGEASLQQLAAHAFRNSLVTGTPVV